MVRSQTRVFYLDAARAAAIALVALNHAVNRTWNNYSWVQEEFVRISRLSTGLKALLTVASRYGVPLFLMITGALILSRPFDSRESVRRFYRHNWLRLLITGEIWTFLGYWFLVFVEPGSRVLADGGIGGAVLGCVKTMLFLDPVRFDSMWYLPMILCIYLLLPMLAWLLQGFPEPRALLYPMIGVFLCDMLVPAVNAGLSLLALPTLHFAVFDYYFPSSYLLYVLAGWWICRGGLGRLSDRAVVLSAALSYLLCVGLQFLCYSRSEHLLSYMSPGILLSSALVFECFRRYAGGLLRWEKPITAMSRAAFALYLLHIFFNMSFHWYVDFSAWSRSAKVLFLEIVPLALSGLVIWPLAKIPFFRKYVFLIK